MKKSFYIVILLFFTLLAGCKSTKSVTGSQADRQMQKVVQKVLEQQPRFQMAQASKISATLVYGERKASVSGSINIITDSAIVLSVQPMMGIELFRLEMDVHSLVLIDKMNRRYVKMSFDEIAQATGMPISFYTLQALCCNQFFAIGQPDVSQMMQTDFELNEVDGKYTVAFTQSNIKHTFSVSPTAYTIENVSLQPDGRTDALSVAYSNYQLTNQVTFPNRLAFGIQAGKYDVQCTFDILRLTINEKANVSTQNLQRYQQVSLSDIMNK